MESIYQIKQAQYPNRYIIIRNDGWNIHELYIKPSFYHNHTKYHFTRGFELCDVEHGNDIKSYFFEKNKKKHDYGKSSELISLDHRVGIYNPRIYRPLLINEEPASNRLYFSKITKSLFNHNPYFDYVPYESSNLTSGIQQLRILIDRLDSIFKNIQPSESNFDTFGHEIRNVLILACTEVEAQFRGILKANGIEKTNYSTNDFIRLLKVLRLNSYAFDLPYFPEVRPIDPFRKWSDQKPTESLVWYNAYNSVKHDREGSFHLATLKNAIDATTAVGILLIAQYGFNIPYWKDLIGNFYELAWAPHWNFEDCYLPPLEGRDWTKLDFKL